MKRTPAKAIANKPNPIKTGAGPPPVTGKPPLGGTIVMMPEVASRRANWSFCVPVTVPGTTTLSETLLTWATVSILTVTLAPASRLANWYSTKLLETLVLSPGETLVTRRAEGKLLLNKTFWIGAPEILAIVTTNSTAEPLLTLLLLAEIARANGPLAPGWVGLTGSVVVGDAVGWGVPLPTVLVSVGLGRGVPPIITGVGVGKITAMVVVGNGTPMMVGGKVADTGVLLAVAVGLPLLGVVVGRGVEVGLPLPGVEVGLLLVVAVAANVLVGVGVLFPIGLVWVGVGVLPIVGAVEVGVGVLPVVG